MQHPKLIVLGLLAKGLKYGLEMERFIETTRMRLWARIGGSTIYKTLLDLQKDGAVKARPGIAERGPGKTVYTLTQKGQGDFKTQVKAALYSDGPVYSDRIAGLVFALALPRPDALKMISESQQGLDKALAGLKTEKSAQKDYPMAQIILEFYERVYAAERAAMEKAKKAFLEDKP